MPNPPVELKRLELKTLSIAYPKVSSGESRLAVAGVSFSVLAGSCLGLVGESGCGKSTIGRAILQLLPPGSKVTGEIWVDGINALELQGQSLQQWRGQAVGLVFQDPMTRLNPLMTVKEHCWEVLQAHAPSLSRPQKLAKIQTTLESVKIPVARMNQYPHEFSGGMRQRVAIALALLLEPSLIIADEPTTSLDVTVAAQILDELTGLCQSREMGLLLISHDLALVGTYCQQVAVMSEGAIVEFGPAKTLLQNPQHPYTQSLLAAAQRMHQAPDTAPITAPITANPQAQPILNLEHLSRHYTLAPNPIAQLLGQAPTLIKAVDDITLVIYQGETLGLVGESGCGKSTLSRTILQLVKPTGGIVQFQGQNLTTLTTQQMRRRRRELQMIFQDPHACLNPLMTVGQNLLEPLLIHGLGTAKTAKARVLDILKQVELVPTEIYFHRYPKELSGGQRQRVAIARALITHPQLVICDEPVSMLDAHIQTQVLELMQQLKTQFNLTYLFITHDLAVARFFCDRIAVMQAGNIVELGSTEQVFNQPQHPYTKSLLQAAPLLASPIP